MGFIGCKTLSFTGVKRADPIIVEPRYGDPVRRHKSLVNWTSMALWALDGKIEAKHFLISRNPFRLLRLSS